MLNYQAVRTHFFDRVLCRAVAAGVRQIVILASGLDSRAYGWTGPAGTRVYEIDQPLFSSTRPRSWPPTMCSPSPSAARLRRPAPGLAGRAHGAGFDPSQPTAWLAEGRTTDVSARRRPGPLFELVTELSAPGSRVSAEGGRTSLRGASRRDAETLRQVRDQLGHRAAPSTCRTYLQRSRRADLTEWLNAHGWRATGQRAVDEMRRLGRWIDIPMADDPDAFATFVVAQKV